MIKIQVVPQGGYDAYKLVRDRVTHEAKTWSWSNKAKTRLRHKGQKNSYVEVGSADGVLVAEFFPGEQEPYFLVEKFVGRLVAWFPREIAAINLQIVPEPKTKK